MTRPLFKHCTDWQVATLEVNKEGGVIVEVGSGSTPPTGTKEYWDGQHPWLTPKEMTSSSCYRYIKMTERTVTEDGLKKAGNLWPEGTVLLTKRAPVGAVAFNNVPMAINQGILAFRCGEKLLPEFLYYWFRANGPYLDAVANGSTYPELYNGDLFEFEIALPSIKEQHAIVSILRTLDEKIELNRRMNTTLEKTAQAIYKSWFEDFDPVRAKSEGDVPYGMDEETASLFPSEFEQLNGQEIPKGWELGSLEDICKKITDGSHYSPKELKNGLHMIATVKNMDLYDFNENTCKRIADDDYEKLVKGGCKPESGDVLLSKDGTMGIVHQYSGNQDLVILSSIAIIKPKNKLFSNYIYYFLKSINFQAGITNHSSGSVLTRIVCTDIKKINILIPDEKIIENFSNCVAVYFNMIVENCKEIRSLTALHESLLLKLISGEVRLPLDENLGETAA